MQVPPSQEPQASLAYPCSTLHSKQLSIRVSVPHGHLGTQATSIQHLPDTRDSKNSLDP